MSTFAITLLLAFIAIVLCAVGFAIGKLITGHSKLSCKRCGNPEKQKKKNCRLCGKKPSDDEKG